MNVSMAQRRARLAAMLVALVALVALAVASPAFAADYDPGDITRAVGKITINPPTDTPSDATNEYTIYKIFDADGNGKTISYKLPSGVTALTDDLAKYFYVDPAGNVIAKDLAKDPNDPTKLRADAVTALGTYAKTLTPTATATSTGTTPAVADNLPNGYYFIATSTGTAVNVVSTNPDVTVDDKGSVPDVAKKIVAVSVGSVDANGREALAAYGAKVSYETDVTIVAHTKSLKLNDTLEAGQKLVADSVKLTVNDVAIDAGNYTLTPTDTGFDVEFKDTYVATIANDTTVKVTYDATVTSDALSSTPSKNDAYITYGDRSAKMNAEPTKVYNAKYTITKEGDGNKPLAGAGFVIKNAEGAYYKNDGSGVTWVTDIADASEFKSDDTGAVAPFSGLVDGTYTIVEKTVPSGYKKMVDSTFTVKPGDYSRSNLEQSAIILNATGATLPTTGGMGTVAFTVVGAVLVVGAAVALITRRRMDR